MHELASSVLGKKLKCGEYAYIEFLALLGTGASGAVYRVQRITHVPGLTQPREDILAAKVIDVRQMNLSHRWDREREKLRREVKILASLSHSGVVNLHGVIDTDQWLVLLMDLVPGGELFNKVSSGPFSEEPARYVFIQVVETLDFLHKASIIHRDLKLENILIANEPAPGFYEVRVADFGLSKAITKTVTLARSYVGTPQYWAPEVILAGRSPNCSYSFEADLWSLGCLLYIMISGHYPFDEEYERNQLILRGEYDHDDIKHVSQECQDIITGLLIPDPTKRLSLKAIKETAWFKKPTWVPLPKLEKLNRPQLHMNLGPLFIGASAGSVEMQEAAQESPIQTPPDEIITNKAVAPSPSSVVFTAAETVPAAAQTPIRADSNLRREEYRESVRTMFDAKAMLALLMSLFHRFHQAYVVFRSNPPIAASIQSLLVDIRNLTTASRSVFQSIQLSSTAVIELLEDVRLTVEEDRPEAAVEMFNNLQSWVQEVSQQGQEMRARHTQALERASQLLQNALKLSGTECGVKSSLQLAIEEKTFGMLEDQAAVRAHPKVEFLDPSSAEPQDILDYVFVHSSEPKKTTCDSRQALEVPTAASMNERHDMTEESSSSTGPGNGSSNTSAPVVICDGGTSFEVVASREDGDSESSALAISRPLNETFPAAAAATNVTTAIARQTALLERGMRELQRVAHMLEDMCLYWDNLSLALSRVSKFREQASVLLKHAAGSQRQKTRLLQRVSDYEAFWDELSKQTTTFVEGSRRSAESMRKFTNTFNESIVRTNALAEYYSTRVRQKHFL